MRRIALIGCSSRKRGKDSPAKLFKAKDIYTGNNYQKSVKQGIKELKCEDRFYILSGKYGLLGMDEEITNYNCYLGKFREQEKRDWAEKVFVKIKKEFTNIDDIIFVIFAGQNYSKYLKLKLTHYELLKFNERQITFEVKEKK